MKLGETVFEARNSVFIFFGDRKTQKAKNKMLCFRSLENNKRLANIAFKR